MAVFRLIAWLMVGVSIAFLGADVITSIEAGEPMVRTTAMVLDTFFGIDGKAWAEASPAGLKEVVSFLMDTALWIIFGIVGGVLTLIFRPME